MFSSSKYSLFLPVFCRRDGEKKFTLCLCVTFSVCAMGFVCECVCVCVCVCGTHSFYIGIFSTFSRFCHSLDSGHIVFITQFDSILRVVVALSLSATWDFLVQL